MCIRDSLETRRKRRDTETRAALVKIHDWLTRHVQGTRPRSAIAKAMHYTLNQWAALALCADHPEIPIHNNTSELRLRQAVTGRKNYLFAGSEGGAASAAILYSLVARNPPATPSSPLAPAVSAPRRPHRAPAT